MGHPVKKTSVVASLPHRLATIYTMKLSVFVIGPSKVGKTVIANYLADLSESLNYTDYHPTQGEIRCAHLESTRLNQMSRRPNPGN